MKQKNNIIIKDNLAKVELRNKDDEITGYAIIDIEDIDLISQYKWYKSKDGYAIYIDRSKKYGTTYLTMHGLIISHLSGFYQTPDHIDRNKLNNRKNNLRITGRSEQQVNHNLMDRNTSGVIGVSFQQKRILHWRASLKYKNHVYNEYFETKEEAIIARLEMEAKYLGEYAPQKHLFEQYGILKGEIDEINISTN